MLLQLVFVSGVAASQLPEQLEGVKITEKLGAQIEASQLKFKDDTGKDVVLSDYFKKGKPVILAMAYYRCPSLCGFLLSGLLDGLKSLKWNTGENFEVVVVSINPKEDSELAAQKKANYLDEYRKSGARMGSEQGWHFLTGEESQIKTLASQVGFGYRYIEKEKEYAHGAAIFVLTPEAKLSRILYGVMFKEQDLKLALLEASSGKIGTIVERILLFCYRYNPATKGYSLVFTRVMQVGSAGTVFVFGGYLAVFWRRQRKRGLKPDALE